MKRIMLMAMALAILSLGVAYGSSPPPSVELSKVDLNTVLGAVQVNSTGGGGACWNFNPEQPGTWGGEFGGGAVTAFPGDPDDAGYCTLNTGETFARHIELRVLDGIADDSFNVYVKNPGGDWVLVYSYTADPSTTEVWKVHHIYSFPAGKGQGDTVEIAILPTNVGWSGFNTWGQLAVDYIKLFDH